MLTTVLVNTITISVPGQRVFFEVRPPDDTIAIVGIETGIIACAYAVPVGNSNIAGDLKLQSDDKTNRCFSTEVTFGNSRMEEAITGFPMATNPKLTELWTSPYSGGSNREPERLRVESCSVLYGSYSDHLGVSGAAISYILNIYTWIERNS